MIRNLLLTITGGILLQNESQSTRAVGAVILGTGVTRLLDDFDSVDVKAGTTDKKGR